MRVIVITIVIIKNEDAIEFANRVKHEIALKGGLVDLVWDGNLKRQQVDIIQWLPENSGTIVVFLSLHTKF